MRRQDESYGDNIVRNLLDDIDMVGRDKLRIY